MEQDQQIFSTENGGLAMALIMGGAKLVMGVPVRHKYTSSMLKKHGAATFQEGQKKALELCRKGSFGIIIYNFVVDGTLSDLMGIYDREMKRLDSGAAETRMEIEPEECVKLAAAYQHFKSAMVKKIRYESIPFVQVDTDDDRVMAAGATASEETLRKLNIIR
jgi:hypothetical protein